MSTSYNNNNIISAFSRNFFESNEVFTCIGEGSLGGKAGGLTISDKIIKEKINVTEFPDVIINIPRLVVLRTDLFDAFSKLIYARSYFCPSYIGFMPNFNRVNVNCPVI